MKKKEWIWLIENEAMKIRIARAWEREHLVCGVPFADGSEQNLHALDHVVLPVDLFDDWEKTGRGVILLTFPNFAVNGEGFEGMKGEKKLEKEN